MKIITRYLLRDIFHYFWIFLVMFVVLLLIYELYDMRGEFLEKDPSLTDIILYLVFVIPSQLSEMLPVIALLSSIFAYGLLAKNREILAMVAAGVSFRFLAFPALVFGLLVTAAAYGFNETVVPYTESRARYLEKVTIGQKDPRRFTQRDDVLVRGAGNSIYFIERYYSDRAEMRFVTLWSISDTGDRPTERIDAVHAVRVEPENQQGKPEVSLWELHGAERRTFDENGRLLRYERIPGAYRIPLEANLDLYLSQSKKPEEMTITELQEYYEFLEAKEGQDMLIFGMTIQRKLSFPLACLLMALLGFGVVADVHARRFARGVFAGILTAVAFYVFSAFMTNLGEGGVLMPYAAAWLPIFVFALVVYLFYTRLNAIRG